jgi:hypothetical protein
LRDRAAVAATSSFYATWAKAYVEALEVAPKIPMKHLVATSNGTETENTVRAFLNRARARKLLTASEPGKPGGELTAKARKILEEGSD